MTKQATLKISGMHCSGCSSNVEKALKSVKGVSSATVDLKANKAVVDFDPALTGEKELVSAVKKAGYGAG
jgi:copper chaperone CopZ